jgi:N-acetylglucosaminyldiphosphoundecaprenol N-acetyl-beta-D-mannosaminyltransferase
MERVESRSGATVLSSWVDAGEMDGFVARVFAWAERRESRYICTTNVHSAVLADRDAQYREVINRADGNTPDGWPIAWAMRQLGHTDQSRVTGPDLMWKIVERAALTGERLYLYGGAPETLSALEERLGKAFPGVQIAGSFSPPFRALTPEEDEAVTAAINASGASIVFVGLGCPKQEAWMAAHRGRVRAVMIGVGAAFDFHSGRVRRAPLWAQRHGLEWLHRLCQEPRRLGPRYLQTNSLFLWRIAGSYGPSATHGPSLIKLRTHWALSALAVLLAIALIYSLPSGGPRPHAAPYGHQAEALTAPLPGAHTARDERTTLAAACSEKEQPPNCFAGMANGKPAAMADAAGQTALPGPVSPVPEIGEWKLIAVGLLVVAVIAGRRRRPR